MLFARESCSCDCPRRLLYSQKAVLHCAVNETLRELHKVREGKRPKVPRGKSFLFVGLFGKLYFELEKWKE
ncbi:MAG: hypothetical protein QXF90_08925 [Thermofilaceae archaeon]